MFEEASSNVYEEDLEALASAVDDDDEYQEMMMVPSADVRTDCTLKAKFIESNTINSVCWDAIGVDAQVSSLFKRPVVWRGSLSARFLVLLTAPTQEGPSMWRTSRLWRCRRRRQ